jgi:DNA invertase Pin-like site-specific DNA recombinase
MSGRLHRSQGRFNALANQQRLGKRCEADGGKRSFFGTGRFCNERLIAVFAEFERDLTEERRVEGMRKYHAMLKKEGRKPGPEKRIDPARVKALRDEGKLIREIMQEVGASKASVYRALREA